MKTFLLLSFSALCLATTYAQSLPDALYQKLQKNLHFSFREQLQLSNLNDFGFHPSQSAPIEKTVCYAFFCKMELKNRERFHIWIKIHAGQYDYYTHDDTH
jgi:hypothetical protein